MPDAILFVAPLTDSLAASFACEMDVLFMEQVYYLNAAANVTCDPGYHMNMGASATYSWRHYVCNSTANTSMYGLYVMPPSTVRLARLIHLAQITPG